MRSLVKETINTPRGTGKPPGRRWHFIKEKSTDKSWSEVRDGGNVGNSKFVPWQGWALTGRERQMPGARSWKALGPL